MDHRRRPSRPIEVRSGRQTEGWLVAAVIAAIAISVAVLTVTQIVLPAFAKVGATLEAATSPVAAD
jgi:hypothetical protein